MKRFLLFLLVASSLWNVSAQPTFEKYYLASGTWKFNIMELASHNFLTNMAYANPDTVNAVGTSLLNLYGVPIHSHCYTIDSLLVLQSIKHILDDEYYLVTNYYGDTCYFLDGFAVRHFNPVIAKMDSMGNVLAASRFVLNDGCQNDAGDLEVTHDKGVLTWGRELSFFALRADSNLAHMWSRHFSRRGGFQFIKELPGGDLLAGINMDTAGVTVARMDANGNFLWCKSYIRPKGIIHDCVIESDSSFILTGFTDSITPSLNGPPPDYHPKLFIMKLNGTGEVQWCKGYVNPTLQWYVTKGLLLKKTLDDKYAVLATLAGRPLLMKLDQNGDTLWTRSAGVNGYSYKTAGLLATSDGGLLYNGAAYGDFGSWSSASYLFKADSLGHLPCSEKQPPSINISELFPVDSSFTLTSVDGAVAYPTGFNDAMPSPIVNYDGCIFTAVGNPTRRNKLRIHPNPSTGHFTLDLPGPLEADSFYSVYDAVGKLLFQRPLAKGTESEEIDLSRFGAGTYLVRVTSKDGVCNERVVVQ
jgi:hypothetical protein